MSVNIFQVSQKKKKKEEEGKWLRTNEFQIPPLYAQSAWVLGGIREKRFDCGISSICNCLKKKLKKNKIEGGDSFSCHVDLWVFNYIHWHDMTCITCLINKSC